MQNFGDYIDNVGSCLQLVDVVKLLAESVFSETAKEKRGGQGAE
jgi:hypothetical protein